MMMKSSIVSILLLMLFTLTVFGQIDQTHPELCGKPDGVVPLPPNISATVDKWQGHGDLLIGPADSAVKISLPNVVDTIDEVCPISGGRLVVFARAGDTLNNIAIVDGVKASLIDSFYGFSAVMSPDQRWLSYGKFFPRHTDLPPSSEYLLYDLTKSPAQNRPPAITPDDWMNVGKPIFPLGQKNDNGDNIGVPEDQQHWMGSPSFYWTQDSRAIVFGDLLQKKFSIVLVTLDNSGNTTALVHPVSFPDICGRAANEDYLNHFESAEFGSGQGGDRSIRIRFNHPGCAPKTLEFHLSDFQPAQPELHESPKPKLKSIITQ